MRLDLALFLVLATLIQSGCPGISGIGQRTIAASNSASPAEEVKEQLGTIGVTPGRLTSRQEPIDTGGMVKGALNGAMTGGKVGLAGGWVVGYAGLVTGALMCVVPLTPACLVGLGVMLSSPAAPVVGAASGAIGGALLAKSEKTIEKSETAIKNAVATEPLGKRISDHIVETLERHRVTALRIPDHSVPPAPENQMAHEIDTLLDTELVALWLSSPPANKRAFNPPFQLSLTMQSKLLRKRDGVELSSLSVSYKSQERPLTGWAGNGAKSLRAELEAASRRMAAETVDFLVLLYPKEVEPSVPQDGAQVSTLKPTLAWAPFSERDNGSADHSASSPRVRSTEYELGVLDGAEILYERAGLHEVNHQISDSLPSCRDLQWRVRARFELDGRIRVSRWSQPQYFKTPCYGKPSTWMERRSGQLEVQTLPEE